MLEGPETITKRDYLTAAQSTIAIWRMTGETTNTVQRLIELWPHVSTHLKLNIMEVFGEMGPEGADAVPFLRALIEKEEPEVSNLLRFYVKNALKEIDPDFSWTIKASPYE